MTHIKKKNLMMFILLFFFLRVTFHFIKWYKVQERNALKSILCAVVIRTKSYLSRD